MPLSLQRAYTLGTEAHSEITLTDPLGCLKRQLNPLDLYHKYYIIFRKTDWLIQHIDLTH